MPLKRWKSSGAEAGATPADPSRPGVASAGESLIGAGMTLDGHCETDGALRVDGHVTGSVRARRLRIGPQGRVDGDVTGDDRSGDDSAVVVDGHVGGAVRAPRVEVGPRGDIAGGLTVQEAVVRGRVGGAIAGAGRLVVEETAVVKGDITTARLAVREGAQLAGIVRAGRLPAPAATSAQTAGAGEVRPAWPGAGSSGTPKQTWPGEPEEVEGLEEARRRSPGEPSPEEAVPERPEAT
jgi:cytoskeletal protein CcmA (bactofilin family)